MWSAVLGALVDTKTSEAQSLPLRTVPSCGWGGSERGPTLHSCVGRGGVERGGQHPGGRAHPALRIGEAASGDA